MKKKDRKEKLQYLFKGDLSPDETEELNSELKKTGSADDEIDSLGMVSELIDRVSVDEPSSSMDQRFYEMLADEARETSSAGITGHRSGRVRSNSFYAGLRVAAGIALFLLGWFMQSWFGQRSDPRDLAKLSGEMKDLRETLVLTMLDQPSSLERIRAVNMVSQLEKADDRIIESLLNALNTDDNDNVRLLSLEALLKYSGNPAVRDGLISSIKNQSSPMIQLRLAEVMVALKERKAAPELRKILTNTGMNYTVRTRINEAVTVLL